MKLYITYMDSVNFEYSEYSFCEFDESVGEK